MVYEYIRHRADRMPCRWGHLTRNGYQLSLWLIEQGGYGLAVRAGQGLDSPPGAQRFSSHFTLHSHCIQGRQLDPLSVVGE